MDLSRKKWLRLLSYLVPITLAGLFNNVRRGNTFLFPIANSFIHYGILSSLLLDAVYLEWVISLRRRFPQKRIRSYTTGFAALFMALSLMRVIKYNIVLSGSTAARYIWYAYYIPLIFGPLLMVLAALCFGKPNDFAVNKKWSLAFIPAALLAVCVLTNDAHGLVFRFAQGMRSWEQTYTYGPLYYVTAGWIALAVTGVLALLIKNTFSRRLYKRAWLPAAAVALTALYSVMKSIPELQNLTVLQMFGMPDIACIGSIALWESLVSAKIIVSNNDYPSIFAASSLNAGLADGEMRVSKAGENAALPSPGALREAANGETLLPDGNTLLKAAPVRGGWFYWTEDISNLRQLNERLLSAAEALTEENDLMRMSAEMDESRRATETQTQLYDSITLSLLPQLDTLERLMAAPPEQEADFRRMLTHCGVLLAYCKRQANLLLQAAATRSLPGAELALCLEESANALRTAGVECTTAAQTGFTLPAQSAAELYRAFETALELLLPLLRSAEISLGGETPVLHFTARLRAQAPDTLPDALDRILRQGQGDRPAARFTLCVADAEGRAAYAFG